MRSCGHRRTVSLTERMRSTSARTTAVPAGRSSPFCGGPIRREYKRRTRQKAGGIIPPAFSIFVMAHISCLREKLHEPPRHPKFIKTVWGAAMRSNESRPSYKLTMRIINRFLLPMPGLFAVLVGGYFAARAILHGPACRRHHRYERDRGRRYGNADRRPKGQPLVRTLYGGTLRQYQQ